MRRRLVMAALTLTALVATVPGAEAVSVTWTREMGRYATAVAVAPDGSAYVAGHRRVSISVGAMLRKYSPSGKVQWTRRWLPSPQASTRGQVVDVAPNGVVVWGGELHGTCEGGGWFLEWRGPGGQLLHRYKTPDWQCGRAEQIRDIVATNDQVVVAGYSHGCCSDPMSDGWIRAFGRDGRPTWETDIEPPAGTRKAWFDTATGLAAGGLGNIYVSGWAATERIVPEESGGGTPILVKVTSGGGVLWTRRAPVKVFQGVGSGSVSIAARGDRIVVAAAARGRHGIHWGARSTPVGWLGAFDLGGGFRWANSWASEPKHGADPGGVALGPDGSAWVIGTMRDVPDRDFDMFIRRYGPGGMLQDRFKLDRRQAVSGSDIQVAGERVYATGGRAESIFDFESEGGLVWRLHA